jgi:hypothetical protein
MIKKIILKILGQNIMKKVKAWFVENGFMGFASLVVAGVALFLGMKLVFAGSIGYFVGKNWEIIRKLWREEYKDKIEDVIDDLKEKVSN